MKTTIREAKSGDLEELAGLVKKFQEEHSRLLGETSTVEYQEISKEVRSNFQEESRGYFLAQTSKEKLIGYRSWEHRDDYYFTKELFVHPDYRREGVARKLIRTMEEWFLKKGQHSACISCAPQNMAMIQLARSEGYKILNLIEIRKNLSEDTPETNEEREALGYSWEIF